MTIVDFVLTLLGVVYVITQSVIFSPIRQWLASKHVALESLLYCPACTGWWVGFALAFTIQPITIWQLLVSAFSGCALGALWSTWGPESVWALERGEHAEAKETNDGEAS